MQVSPTEIEEMLLRHPEGLVIDVTVSGVSGGRTADERVPRAWVVLSPNGRALGATEVVARLDMWIRETLSRYKWLRGGIAVVNQVSPILALQPPVADRRTFCVDDAQIPKSPTGKVLRRALVDEYEAELRSRDSRL